MKRVLLLVLLAGPAAGCSWDPGEITYPLPTEAITWPMPMQSPASQRACPSIELAPINVEWDSTHRTLSLGGEKVLFPPGFMYRELPSGHVEIVAPDGTVVARDGDMLELGGSDYSHVCRVGSVEY